jgi:hypothetical protein
MTSGDLCFTRGVWGKRVKVTKSDLSDFFRGEVNDSMMNKVIDQ